ncbi:MAG: hypothetical protein ACKVH8_07955 [Pirellulales bacterium]|jgi:hypothetical protein
MWNSSRWALLIAGAVCGAVAIGCSKSDAPDPSDIPNIPPSTRTSNDPTTNPSAEATRFETEVLTPKAAK